MTTVPVPCVAAIAAAASSARSVSHGPGRRPPSHVCAAGRELTTVGAPVFRHRALLDLAEVGREQRESVRRVAEQIAGDEHVGDVACDVGAHAGALAAARAAKRTQARRRHNERRMVLDAGTEDGEANRLRGG